jgi:hypothetical protein
VALVIVGAATAERVDAAVRVLEAEGFASTAELVGDEPNRVLGLPGGGAEMLCAADDRGVRYVLVHVGAPDGQEGGTYDRAHHRIEPPQLTDLARRAKTRDRLLVTCLAFGFKNGLPDGGGWVVDARCLDNPYWVPELRELDGRDVRVRDFVLGQPPATILLDGLEATLVPLLDEYARRGRSELTVAFGCTGGRHRSVVLALELARRLQAIAAVDVEVRTRELAG